LIVLYCARKRLLFGRRWSLTMSMMGDNDSILPTTEHDHTPEEERKIREAALDETIAGTFPASDPPSSIPNPDEHDALVNEEGSGH
jgi:hypothetical protein